MTREELRQMSTADLKDRRSALSGQLRCLPFRQRQDHPLFSERQLVYTELQRRRMADLREHRAEV